MARNIPLTVPLKAQARQKSIIVPSSTNKIIDYKDIMQATMARSSIYETDMSNDRLFES